MRSGVTLRLGKRLGFVSNGGYADLAQGADEVGRMLGGWLKYERLWPIHGLERVRSGPVIAPVEPGDLLDPKGAGHTV